jgi:succinyl-CoA synthetase beta subunit
VWSESAARRLLDEVGFPLVAAELAATADEAIAAAKRLGYPVALKACAAGLAHKSDIGAVALDLINAGAVRDAFTQVAEAVRKQPDVEVEGVLVAPMRTGGLELLAGVTVDPTFGPVLAVGLGGVWVEVMRDVALRVLPVGPEEIAEMLDELKGSELLRGARGMPAVALDQVAGSLAKLAEAAALAGPALQALEVNPLWCGPDRIEGLDARLITTSAEG